LTVVCPPDDQFAIELGLVLVGFGFDKLKGLCDLNLQKGQIIGFPIVNAFFIQVLRTFVEKKGA